MESVFSVLRAVADALDGLEVGVCVFDEADAALLWNRYFLTCFPEHEAQIHVGEPYRANLRRFYATRLSEQEMPSIDRYIEAGVERHRLQLRPYDFVHRGRHLVVSSLPLPGVGRLRVWRVKPEAAASSEPVDLAASLDGPLAAARMLDHVADGLMVTSASDAIVSVNRAFVEAYGLRDHAAALGASFEDVYRSAWQGQEDDERLSAGLAGLIEHLRFSGAPFELPLPGDRWIRVAEQAGPQGVRFWTHVDITAARRQQERLLEAERRARESEAQLRSQTALLEATLERMEQGVMLVSPQRIVEVCNRRAIELLQLPPELMSSRPAFEAVLEHQWAAGAFDRTPEDIREFIRSGGILDHAHSYERLRPDGRVIEVRSVPVEGGGVLRTYTDITERRVVEDSIRHVARTDGLTSLANRGAFLDRLDDLLRGAAHGARPGFAVHYIDLDRFKPINDSHGHATGDKVLTLVAQRMRSLSREGDFVARMGGDEFAVLQLPVDSAQAALGLAQRMIAGLQVPMEVDGMTLEIGASIGVAIYPQAGTDRETLLRHADVAMYQAKAAGRNQARLFESRP